MLPTSHLVPINQALDDNEGGLQIDDDCSLRQFPKDPSGSQVTNAALLAGAFSEFISASSRLEMSYTRLQQEVYDLGLELSERNAALKSSLAKNENMRLALQQIVDSMPCGVLVLDKNEEVSMVNPESIRLLGLDEGLFRQDRSVTLRRISEISGVSLESSSESSSRGDVERQLSVRDTLGIRWLEIRKRSLFHPFDKVGKPEQTILILRDITTQKRAELEREAGRKAMALAEITTVLAHEIRNPLAILELFSELIEEDEDRRAEWISNLRAGIRSLSGTVNNVLTFHGSGSLQLAPISLSVMIGNAIKFVQPLASQAAVSLDWVDDQNQIQVMGNESAIQQVVLNLISNAIRHTASGGSVNVSILPQLRLPADQNQHAKERQVIVEFSDTGCGIRPDQIGHVFEPGFSGDGDTSGLGLAVCARIMKQHGGDIIASNRVDSGAQFSLSFPVLQLSAVSA